MMSLFLVVYSSYASICESFQNCSWMASPENLWVILMDVSVDVEIIAYFGEIYLWIRLHLGTSRK